MYLFTMGKVALTYYMYYIKYVCITVTVYHLNVI